MRNVGYYDACQKPTPTTAAMVAHSSCTGDAPASLVPVARLPGNESLFARRYLLSC